MNRCGHSFGFCSFYLQACFSFSFPSLFVSLFCIVFFFQNVATNGCLAQTSRMASQGYMCIFKFLPHTSSLSLRIQTFGITPCISHQRPFTRHLPNPVGSQVQFQIDKMKQSCFFPPCFVTTHTHTVERRGLSSEVVPGSRGNCTDPSICTAGASLCPCVVSRANKSRRPCSISTSVSLLILHCCLGPLPPIPCHNLRDPPDPPLPPRRKRHLSTGPPLLGSVHLCCVCVSASNQYLTCSNAGSL